MFLPVRPIFLYYSIFCYFLYYEVSSCNGQRMRTPNLKKTIDSNQMASHKFQSSINSKPMNSPNSKPTMTLAAKQGMTHIKNKEVEPVTSFPLKDSCFSSPMIIVLPEQTEQKCDDRSRTTEFPFSRCLQVQDTEAPKSSEFRNRMPMECIPNNFGAVCPCGEQTEISIMKSITTGKPKPQVYSCKWEGKLIQTPELISGLIQ